MSLSTFLIIYSINAVITLTCTTVVEKLETGSVEVRDIIANFIISLLPITSTVVTIITIIELIYDKICMSELQNKTWNKKLYKIWTKKVF